MASSVCMFQLASPEEKCQQLLEPPYDEMVAAHLRYCVMEKVLCHQCSVRQELKSSVACQSTVEPVLYIQLKVLQVTISTALPEPHVYVCYRCTYAVANHDFVEAYKFQTLVVQSFLRAFQSHKEENWALPVMFAVTLDLRIFANNAEQQLQKKGKGQPGEMLEKAAEQLMSCFRVCASDNRAGIEDSKKWGMMFLSNQLFKIYFKINKLHLCKPLIRAIDSSNLKNDYSPAQKVTYKYYVGRKAMFDSDFKLAEEFLSYAFHHCHRSSQKNKRMILIYLLPVKMLLGHMPTHQLLRKYDLMQFADVTKAVGEGNLLLLNEALSKHETFFIRCGIFLILEKLKIITYRNLFKKVYLLLRTHQLPLDAFLVALRMMQVEDVDIDEVQCILANLIYMGHIKGYISHQHQKLVVSKQNPFPPLSSVS
uniref:PCI domain-containing protein 2 n=1 Tax=Monopterus albus TaxID=43700 RepID=A0A3Q3IPT0_MONAL